MNQKKEVSVVIEKQLAPVVKRALELEIKSVDDMKVATELLSVMNKFNDQIVEEKEKITKPLNEALKVERNRWKPAETMYQKGIDWVRSQMSSYQMEAIKKQKIEQDKIANDLANGKIKKIETAVRKLENIETVDNKVSVDTGSVQFVEQKKLKITNIDLIPRMYLVVDEKKVMEDLKAGRKIEGAEIEIVLVPRNYR